MTGYKRHQFDKRHQCDNFFAQKTTLDLKKNRNLGKDKMYELQLAPNFVRLAIFGPPPQ